MVQGKQLGKSDEWYTPKYIFDALDVLFDMDVASPTSLEFIKTPTETFITSGSLEREWKGFVWCNPPFGGRNGILPWIRKIVEHGSGILLTPDRTSAPWWNEVAMKSDGVLFINGKVRFINQDGVSGDQPANGTCLFAFGDEGIQGLINAQNNGLGIMLINHKY